MVKVGKKTPKILKRSKVNTPQRLIVVQCWVNKRKTQSILWIEWPTGALMDVGSF